MTRLPHVIRVAQGDRIPSRWLLVACDLSRSDLTPDGKIASLRLRRAVAECVRLDGTHIHSMVRHEYEYGGDFIADLDYWCATGTSVTVVMRQALQSATVLGLWDAISSGAWELTGTDPSGGANGHKGPRRRFKGVAVLENPPFVLQLRSQRTGGTARIVDVRNYGVPGPPVSMEAPLAVREIILWLDGWLASLRRLNLGSFQNTLASQAYYGWRRTYMSHAVDVHCNALALDLERLAYYGGRNECNFVGVIDSDFAVTNRFGHYGSEVPYLARQGPISRLDVNCAYGAAAAQNNVPVELVLTWGAPDSKGAAVAIDTTTDVAAVTVETYRPCLPYSPHRDYLLDKVLAGKPLDWTAAPDLSYVVYPVGYFRTVLCGPELALAVRLGRIVAVHAVARYRMAPAFKRWAEALWKERTLLRDTGDDVTGRMLKLLPVLLFGKFGQRLKAWRDDPKEPSCEPYATWYGKNPDGPGIMRWRSVGYRVQRLVEGGETNESCPMIPAWINSLARANLWRLMEVAGHRESYYADTDSLWVSDAGLSNLLAASAIDHDRLGALKIEASYKRCEFVGQKHYICDGARTLAAMPNDAASDGSLLYWWADVEGFPAALPRSEPPQPVERTFFRHVPTTYNAGQVGSDGWVKPYYLQHRES